MYYIVLNYRHTYTLKFMLVRSCGPPADKRDLTTFCNKLTNTHLKSVKNHSFLLSFKEGSFMRDA